MNREEQIFESKNEKEQRQVQCEANIVNDINSNEAVNC